MLRTCLLAWALAATPALAQEPESTEKSEDPGPPGAGVDSVATTELPPGSIKGRVSVEMAEVRAGPGAVYVARGRVYQGDVVDVRRRNEGGTWVEVVGGGLRGWIRVKELVLERPGAAPPIEGGDAGRDRRETNYEYDAEGRRLWPDGRPVGSGEGTDGFDPPAAPVRNRGSLFLRAGLGVGRISRTFSSNIAEPSALRALSVDPTTAALEVDAHWDAHEYVAVRGGLRLAMLGSAQVPASEDLGLSSSVEIAASAVTADADAIGRIRFGSGWAGVYAGGRFLRHGFQETKPFPLLLTTTAIGAAGGGAAYWRFGRFDAAARAGLVKPLSVSQSPADSGEVKAAGGFEVVGDAAYAFRPGFAAFLSASFLRLTFDYRGASSHTDPKTGTSPKTYSGARERDELLTAVLGLRWRP